MRPLKTKVSITLDDDLLPMITRLAEEEERSLSQYINLVLKSHIKTKEKKQIK